MAHISKQPPALPAALGLCLLVAAGLHSAGAVQPPAANADRSRELLADLEAFETERSTFRRLLPGKPGVTEQALGAYYAALFATSEGWVRRWPHREFAWRARLEALLGLHERRPAAAREAAARAIETLEHPDNVVYPEPLELLAARALVRHHIELPLARKLARRALERKLEFLDRLEAARPGESFAERRRRWRWRTALVTVEASEAEGDLSAWGAALDELERSASADPRPSGSGSHPLSLLDNPRQAAVEYAAGQVELHRQRARFARAVGREVEALSELLRAVELRPAFRSKVEPPTNQAAIDEALGAWLASGRSREEWKAWIERRKGYPIPRAVR